MYTLTSFQVSLSTKAWFPYDHLDRLKGKRRRVVSDVSGLDNRIFACVLQPSHINGWFLFVKRTSYFGICFSSWFYSIEKQENFEILMSRTFSNFKQPTNTLRTFVYYFFGFSAIRAEFILDYWNKSDDFWDSFRSSRSSQSSESVSIWSLQLYPSDRCHLSRPGRLQSSG